MPILDPISIKATFVEKGLKATQQRIVVYEALMRMMNHPTAEMVYDAIKEQNPTITLATVYKTLDTFVSHALATKVMTDGGYLRYDGNMDSHGHIYCENTNEIIDFEDHELHDILQKYFTEKKINNLSVKDIRIQILGDKVDTLKEISFS